MNAIDDEIVQLNVGGVTKGFTVTRELMKTIPGSYLDAMFSGKFQLKKVDGKVYLNRDPEIFKLVLRYLRNQVHPKTLDAYTQEQYDLELKFLGI